MALSIHWNQLETFLLDEDKIKAEGNANHFINKAVSLNKLIGDYECVSNQNLFEESIVENLRYKQNLFFREVAPYVIADRIKNLKEEEVLEYTTEETKAMNPKSHEEFKTIVREKSKQLENLNLLIQKTKTMDFTIPDMKANLIALKYNSLLKEVVEPLKNLHEELKKNNN